MDEIIVNGCFLESAALEMKQAEEYNSVRWFLNGVEINPSGLEMVIYNDKEQNEES